MFPGSSHSAANELAQQNFQLPELASRQALCHVCVGLAKYAWVAFTKQDPALAGEGDVHFPIRNC
jgi:hypothetical protein